MRWRSLRAIVIRSRTEPGVLDADRLALLEHAPQPGLFEGLAHDRRRHRRADAVREGDQRGAAFGVRERLEDRGRRVADDRLSALAAEERRRARVERTQVVGDGGHRADRGARGAHRRRAVDGHRRQHAQDALGPGPVEPLQELSRIRAEGLGVAAVALGVEHVESERGLAGARDAGDDRDRADRDPDAHVLQVVLARLLDADRGRVEPAAGRSRAGHPHTFAQAGVPGKRPGGICARPLFSASLLARASVPLACGRRHRDAQRADHQVVVVRERLLVQREEGQQAEGHGERE